MGKRKNNAINTASKAGEIFRSAAKGCKMPPEHIRLRDGDWPFWQTVIEARRDECWNDLDMEHAANLCRCFADINQLQGEIEMEGDIVEGRLNLKHKLIEILSRRSVSLCRLLQIHSLALHGKSSNQARRNEAARDARDSIADGDNELIPGLRPN